MNIKIRKAKPNEYEKVLALYPEQPSEKIKEINKNVTKNFEKIKSKNRIIYFAEIDDEVIAAVQLVFELKDKDLANGKNTANLHHLRVAKPYRKQGIGKLLEKKLISEARKRGFEKITLSVEHNDSLEFLTELYTKWDTKFSKKFQTKLALLKIFNLTTF